MPFEQHFSSGGAEYLISDERSRLDFPLMQAFLAQTYWSPGLSSEQLRRQVDNSSLAFGLYELCADGSTPQVGFARVVSDLTRFAYLSDVFIIESQQRRGLGQLLVAGLMEHPELQGIRRWLLATNDAHGVYEKLGFSLLRKPERWMEKKRADDIPGWL